MALARVAPLALAAAGAAAAPGGWIARLEANGFAVQEGEYGFFDMQTCKAADTCYAINPLTPYGLSWLPRHPREAAAQVGYENSCVRHRICRGNASRPLSPSWRVDRGETVVILGRTPPESVYWSFAPTLYTRYHPAPFLPRPGSVDRMLVACPPALLRGNRCEVFSGVNDPVNHLTANTSGRGAPFAVDFALVLSWDASSERRTLDELRRAGHENVNVLRFPGGAGRLGVVAGDEDEWMAILRVEGIKDEQQAKAFYAGAPYRTFRVTPPASFVVQDEALFASFDGRMRERATGGRESAGGVGFEQLRRALKRVQLEILREEEASWRGVRRHVAATKFETFVNDSGYECLAHGTKCAGDCRDTIYAKATFLTRQMECMPLPSVGPCNPAETALLSEEEGDAFFAFGVNHQLTGQALYSSVTGYNFPKLAAVTGAIADDAYAGTAERYLGPADAAARYLWVVKFARSCAGSAGLCVEIPAASEDPAVSPLALHEPLFFLERMYVNPKTNSGPAVSETILGGLLHFKPQRSIVV
uniref:Uncharacterized protein n=1 Tax=Zooxanthella nutricula TaxID=1333877 RepID=A0A7S2KE78_9DINO